MNATQQMAAFRPQMLSYAARQLGDDELAEDVVQDAFVAAFDRADAFRGEAALKTWVFAILKNKIADALRGRYRRQSREVSYVQDEDPEGDDLEALLFRADGHWEQDPAPWARPSSCAPIVSSGRCCSAVWTGCPASRPRSS